VTGGADVVVNGFGQLGSVVSSKRFKRDIVDIGDRSQALMKLRPVTFHYKDDPSHERQYGLVAEEVAPVYPELVTHDQQGRVESVRYSMLSSMLLNELQKQNRESQRQSAEIKALTTKVERQTPQIESLTVEVEQLTAQLAAVEQAMALSKAGGARVSKAVWSPSR
jgi:hypothetical protein